jgi:hypothetical protein
MGYNVHRGTVCVVREASKGQRKGHGSANSVDVGSSLHRLNQLDHHIIFILAVIATFGENNMEIMHRESPGTLAHKYINY